ncbi:MAG: alanine--glyoxylate aminotransferase family protein [Gemmatimonadales bacterium]|nr:MAG: alanine--glyoxylate aminotransferase family protein [Gemmatimonadales bacterium]
MSATPPIAFTTGPSQLHPLVADELAAAASDGTLSDSHRSPRFRSQVARTVEALRALLDIPPDHRVLFCASASEAMERIVQGTVRDRSLHLVNGAFARRFHRISQNLGFAASAIERPDGEGYDADHPLPGIDAPGSEGPPQLVAMTQNETSTGVRIRPDAIHALADRVRAAGALAAVDLVSGWPVEAVDPARVDAGFFSIQKAFGLPAGLGVIVASPALVERSRALQTAGRSVGGYQHLPALADAADGSQTVATPNMLGIRLLGRVAEDYLERGIDAIRAETDGKARALWDAIDDLPGLHPFVRGADADRIRSRTILVVETEPSADPVRAALRDRGFLVSDGYGPWKGRQLRIANFPSHSPEAMEALIRALRDSA